jgi:diketogulonate reductase-like aldo/keto reductase
MPEAIDVQGIRVPAFLYGTAWKEDRTEVLVEQALAAGFRAIDTANQRKHYFEAAVGAGIAASGLSPSELFLQTKFTYVDGQDHRLPYDPRAPLTEQVRQSFTSSLEHLRVERIDSYVLHGPWSNQGWSPEDRETWAAMEALHAEGRARLLGLSNVSLGQLRTAVQSAKVAPAFVQNRCYASRGWDRDVRAFCKEHGIVYQGFSLLTANRRELMSPAVRAIAERLGATIPQVVFRFARALGVLPLTGTTDPTHMREDLQSEQLTLTAADVTQIEGHALPL